MGTNQSRAHLKRFSISLALAAAALLLPRQALADACVWTGTTSTNWDTASNWSSCGGSWPDTTGDTATISTGTPHNNPVVASGDSFTVYTLTVNGGTLTVNGTLTLGNGFTGAGNLVVSSGGTLNWNGGVMDGAGTSTIQAGATLNLTNSYGQLQRTMTSAGTTNINGSGYIYLYTGGSFSNSGTMNLMGNSYAIYGNATTFTNTGTINRTTGSGTATINNLAFVNSGTVNVQTGTLDFSTVGSGTHSGTFAVSASAVLQFSNSQTHTFNGAITGAGSVTFSTNGTSTLKATFSPAALTISAGTVNFNQASAQSLPNLTMTNGTLAGTAAINMTGTADLNYGTLAGSGIFTFANGTTTTLDSSYLSVTRPLVNAGTITFLTNAYFYFQAGGSFTNQASGVVDIENNYYGFYGDGNTPINNTGTVKRTTSSGTASIYNTKFINTSPGKVQVETGTLDIGIPTAVTQTGTFTVAAGANLQFSGAGTDTISGPINGGGSVTFASYGGTNLTGSYGISDTRITAGTVNFNQGSAQSLASLTLSGGTLAGSAAMSITNTADLNSGTLAGSGVFTLANGTTAVLDSSYITIQRPFVNQTTLVLSGNAYLYITGGSFNNQATGVVEIQNNTYALYGSSAQNFTNAGTISRTTSSGTTTIYNLNITNTGTVSVESGILQIYSSTFTQTAGAVHLNGGNLEVIGSPGVLNIQGGVFDGNGTLNGNVSVSASGQFNPGTSPGEISITNSHTYTQAAPGVLNIDVNGTTAGFDYDRILISGAATLGGELKVHLGYSPALGDSFTILEHASRTGTFSKLTFPSPGSGRGWDISYSATETKLTIAALAGAFLVVDGHAGTGTSSDGNGVLEAGERVLVEPNWLNLTDSSIASAGTASNITGPAGATYTLNDTTAGYGTTSPNSTTGCFNATGDCFQASVSDPASRPAVHWDAAFKETITGGSNKTWTLHVGESFTDVPRGQAFYAKIETLLHTGITAGCTTTTYCPSGTVSRGAMAIFVAKGLAGGGANVPVSGSVSGSPYNCVAGVSGVSLFTDVAPTDIFCKHVHYIAAQKVTGGCSGTTYCPNGTITRLEMAAFIAKALVAPAGGTAIPLSYTDPVTNLSYNCNGANIHFTDVPYSNQFCKHVHFLWAKGIIGGISPTLYGPGQNVTRDAMAKFLSNAFNLLLYGPVP